MFTAFLPEDFQIISPGQLKTKLGPFLSPTPEAVAVLGPCGDTPNTAERGPAVQSGVLGCREGCQGAERAVRVQSRLSGCRLGCQGAEQAVRVQSRLLGCREGCRGAEQAVGVQAECTGAADWGGGRAEGSWVQHPNPARGDEGRGWPRPHESHLLRQALTRHVRQRGLSALWPLINHLLKHL